MKHSTNLSNPIFRLTKTSLAVLAITLATSSTGYCRKVLIDANHSVSQTGILIGAGGPAGPTTEPDDPYSKPRTPSQPGLVSRDESSVKIQWTDNSSYETGFRLYRSVAYGGPWELIASWGAAQGNSSVMQYTDTGLPRDKAYYYRVGVYNFQGESFSIPQSFATIDGRSFSRLQILLRIANVSDANTDDDLNVSLRDNDNGGTWLDYGRDDFERGDVFTYELQPNNLSDLSDINNIRLLKLGTNGLCLAGFSLLADGEEIYNQDFSASPSKCQWLDDSKNPKNFFYVGRDKLRAHPLWQAYQQPIPSIRLLRTDLESRIEGMVGNVIHYGVPVDAFPLYQGTLGVDWTDEALDGESHVAVSKADDQAVHVHFELHVDTPGPGGLTGGIDFDLRFTGICRTETTPAKIEMVTENMVATADFDWTTEAVSLWLVNLLEDSIANKIKNSFPQLEQNFTVDNQIISCVTPVVEDDGTVDFDLTFAKKTGTVADTDTGTISDDITVMDTVGTLSGSATNVNTKVLGTFGTILKKP